jgi:hypothetical protein
VFSFKSRAWQLGLTTILLVVTYLFSLTSTVSTFEYDLFLYILDLQPYDRELFYRSSISVAPRWFTRRYLSSTSTGTRVLALPSYRY